jgi:hypothetical protein
MSEPEYHGPTDADRSNDRGAAYVAASDAAATAAPVVYRCGVRAQSYLSTCANSQLATPKTADADASAKPATSHSPLSVVTGERYRPAADDYHTFRRPSWAAMYRTTTTAR